VISISGIDCIMNCNYSMFDGWSELSFLENSIDAEVLWTTNTNSVGDLNHAKQELVIEISDVHLLISRSRVERLSKLVPVKHYKSHPEIGKRPLPPRLEVLSQLILQSVDFHIQHLCLSLLKESDRLYDTAKRKPVPRTISQKQNELKDSLHCFLAVVSTFNLGYPLQEAISAAMQISIDRLTGLGIALEEAWEATHTSLLNFLEDVAEMKIADTNNTPQHSFESFTFSSRHSSVNADALQDVVLASANRTATMFSHLLSSHYSCSDDDMADVRYDFVLDMSDGVRFSLVNLFYDKYMAVCVPTVFVTDAAGIHLLRITSPDEKLDGGSDDSSLKSNASDENVKDGDSIPSETSSGVLFRSFILDKQHHFGRGGQSLSVLGTDAIADPIHIKREREQLQDIEVGDVELLFSLSVYDELVASLRSLMQPLESCRSDPPKNTHQDRQESSVDTYKLSACTGISMQFANDRLIPFTQLGLKGLILRGNSFNGRQTPSAEASKGREVSSTVQSLSLLNLTPEGEMHPEVISVLPGFHTHVVIKYSRTTTGSDVEVHLSGIRVVFLQQHLNEFMQYFVSGNYGFGLFRESLKKPSSNQNRKRYQLRYIVHVYNSSVLLPRSTLSSDIVAMEVTTATVSSNDSLSSFVMPTKSSGLFIPGLQPTKIDNAEKAGSGPLLSRVLVKLCGVRLFTSLPEKASSSDGTETPSFRNFYSIDGRAEPGKMVYCQRVNAAAFDYGDNFGAAHDHANERYWEEITQYSVSLDILVDKAPHLRLLISDELISTPTHFALDVRLSQFALLLSLWYCNMQELPQLFPYPASQVEKIARGPSANAAKYPEHGTSDFVSMLMNPQIFTSEIAVVLGHLSLKCSFDYSFFDNKSILSEEDVFALALDLHDAVIHVSNDILGVSRIGCGSSEVLLVDESKTFEKVMKSGSTSCRGHSWADLSFGLKEDYHQLTQLLPQPFQLSIFMTPGWSIYNCRCLRAVDRLF